MITSQTNIGFDLFKYKFSQNMLYLNVCCNFRIRNNFVK